MKSSSEQHSFRVSDLCCAVFVCSVLSPSSTSSHSVCAGELIAQLCREYLSQHNP